MLVFVEERKPEYLEKNPQSRDENQQQTQPTHDADADKVVICFVKQILSKNLVY